MKLTELEFLVYSHLKSALAGYEKDFLDVTPEDLFLSLNINISTLRGVLSSLVKKNLIEVVRDDDRDVYGKKVSLIYLKENLSE